MTNTTLMTESQIKEELTTLDQRSWDIQRKYEIEAEIEAFISRGEAAYLRQLKAQEWLKLMPSP